MQEFIELKVLPRLEPTGVHEWTIDVLRREDGTYVLIEINAFGADLRTGGCLFHWGIDHDVLYGTKCQMRVCQGGDQQSGFIVLKIV